ncbi:MAG: hypothetical protein JOZ62_13210 [Acidobacteriaceae bacterium]|nr:hypothetical protein [Acidobacteriaceae bacterium]
MSETVPSLIMQSPFVDSFLDAPCHYNSNLLAKSERPLRIDHDRRCDIRDRLA